MKPAQRTKEKPSPEIEVSSAYSAPSWFLSSLFHLCPLKFVARGLSPASPRYLICSSPQGTRSLIAGFHLSSTAPSHIIKTILANVTRALTFSTSSKEPFLNGTVNNVMNSPSGLKSRRLILDISASSRRPSDGNSKRRLLPLKPQRYL
jgi:hypothetical protein